MRELRDIRVDIDEIDDEIIRLYRQRLKLSEEVYLVKKEQNIPVLDASREKEKLDAIESRAESEEEAMRFRNLFSFIMKESREVQQSLFLKGEK